MNGYTLDSAGATVLRALLAGLFIALFIFPLLLSCRGPRRQRIGVRPQSRSRSGRTWRPTPRSR